MRHPLCTYSAPKNFFFQSWNLGPKALVLTPDVIKVGMVFSGSGKK